MNPIAPTNLYFFDVLEAAKVHRKYVDVTLKNGGVFRGFIDQIFTGAGDPYILFKQQGKVWLDHIAYVDAGIDPSGSMEAISCLCE